MSRRLENQPLASLVTITGGGTPSKARPEYYQGDIPWVTPKDMKSWDITDAQDHISEEAIARSATKLIEPGSILLVIRSGILKHTLPVGINRVPVAINQDMKALRCGPGLDPDYLARALQWAAPRILGTVRATTADNIPLDVVRRLEVPVPPLAEQHRIAAILDRADAIRCKRHQAIQLTDDLFLSAFLDMFGDPITNPKGWPTATVGDIAPGRGFIVDGPFGSSLKPECYVPTGVRVIRNFNIKPGRFDGSAFRFVTADKFEELRRSEVAPGDILISTKGTIGNVCLMPGLPGPSLLSATGTVRVRVPHGAPVRAAFLVAQMSTGHYRHYISTLQAGSNQQYLNLTAIRRMGLAIPPLALQDKYLRNEEAGRHARALREDASRTTSELFSCLVQRAFTGELSYGGTGSVGSTGVDE
jgi:type I restriction enzyme S subunit